MKKMSISTMLRGRTVKYNWTFCFSPIFLLLVTSLPSVTSASDDLQLRAVFSQNGVWGTITFRQTGTSVQIFANMSVAADNAGDYSWGIYEYPIDYSRPDHCHSRHLGRKPLFNFDANLGKISLVKEEEVKEPEEPVTEEPGVTATSLPDEEKPEEEEVKVESVEQPKFYNRVYEFTLENEIELSGPKSIWSRSLVLEGPSRDRVCATIEPEVDESSLKVAEARFTSPVAGSVWFTALSKGDSVETKILTNLFQVSNPKSSNNAWQIFITDILDTDNDIQRGSCDFLQLLYDPLNKNGEGCSEEDPSKCREGDLSGKFGHVKVGKEESMFTKNYFTDVNLELPELDGHRSLYLVLFDEDHPDTFLACAKIRPIRRKVARASFSYEGVQGAISFSQASPFHPVEADVRLTGLGEGAGSFHAHEFPVPAKIDAADSPCGRTGGHFNPTNIDPSTSPKTGEGSFDKYELGDLSGKYGDLTHRDHLQENVVDPTMTLFGPLSIVGRSIVIHKSPVPKRWICANIDLYEQQFVTAIATFTYPVAGRIIFRQAEEEPFSDTTVFVESLLYSDGSKNDTRDHRWHVHQLVPGKDFFNWTGRCLSAGGHYNPHQVSLESYKDCSDEKRHMRCEVGDLVNKLGLLNVAGRKRDIKDTIKFFTDSNLPLSGPHSIVGRSILIHDDNAPEHRGDRMACTPILRRYRHKAVAREWFGNGAPTSVDGRLEFIQDEGGMSHTLVDLKGLGGQANSYHIHVIPIQPHFEFPCTGDAIGAHFAPYNFDPSTSPKPAVGTPDQYEVGDLSGKYGLLDDMDHIRSEYNDTNLPMFGLNSIVGRSIVVHKKNKGERWACASLGWGFDPDEATQVSGIASFHHPNGFAWGYIRFRQVQYKDGSRTDTSMEVRLKYPGKSNNKVTTNHDWSIYVNPVGHDASVEFQTARCTAAGYRWNPTHIQLADPNDRNFYGEECGKDYPLRCEVGDMSGRNGKIDIGGKAFVLSDVNLQLKGEDWFTSAMGKSIVIHGPDGSSDRMACANIEEDHDIVKFATIHTKARFNLASFMEEVQSIMGVPEWYLYTDSRHTKELHQGRCHQIQLHFAGPHAAQLEQDFGRLMRTGRQDGPSINIPGYIPDPNRKTKFGYKECDSEAVNASPNTDIKRTYSSLSGGSLSLSTHNKSHGIFLFSTFLLMLLMHHQRL